MSLEDFYNIIESHNPILFMKIEKYLKPDIISQIIDTCNKQRFSYKEENSKFFIRANQGHSLAVGSRIDFSKVLKLIDTPLPGVFHGSYNKHLESIKKDGLKRIDRFHIHIAKSLDAKSGKRDKADLIVYVNMEEAMKDNIIFYESENGVILTEGINGTLPSKYLTYASLINGELSKIE